MSLELPLFAGQHAIGQRDDNNTLTPLAISKLLLKNFMTRHDMELSAVIILGHRGQQRYVSRRWSCAAAAFGEMAGDDAPARRTLATESRRSLPRRHAFWQFEL